MKGNMVSRTATITLPGELIDQIIDHLHDDISSLQACCLTCRTWMPSARIHLFCDVLLTTERAAAFALLLDASPDISLFVKRLNIQGDASQLYSKSGYIETIVPTIAPKLTRLSTLRIDSVTLAHLHPKALSALIDGFPVLKTLSLSSVTFEKFRDFAALVIAHPLIERLDLGHIWWSGVVNSASRWDDVFHAYPDSRSRLRCISLNDTSFNVLDWILSHYRVLPIHTFSHSTITTRLVPQIARFLNKVGPSLEHLTFCIHVTPKCFLETQGSPPLILGCS